MERVALFKGDTKNISSDTCAWSKLTILKYTGGSFSKVKIWVLYVIMFGFLMPFSVLPLTVATPLHKGNKVIVLDWENKIK